MGGELVLVTGGSGFLGTHCILALLDAGYRVRTTVRSLSREGEVRRMVKAGGADPEDKLSFVAADLTSDAGWPEAVAGCAFVLHVASPFVLGVPQEREDELIVPAREGTLRILRAARDVGVKRVVVTSSSEAIIHDGPKPKDDPYTEEDWSNPAHGMTPYGKSKILAERAAWEFISREGGGLELAVVNPVGIFGPVLGPELSVSIDIIAQMLEGAFPRVPHLAVDLVDVRDLADLHLRAMTNPAANGQRFLASAGLTSLKAIAQVLKSGMGKAAEKVSAKTIPDWVLRLVSVASPQVAGVVPFLGKPRRTTSEKAFRLLGWKSRALEESVVATAESLLRLGLPKDSRFLA